MTDFVNEKEMQDRIGSLIRDRLLGKCITGAKALRGLLDESPNLLPVFSIDHLARLAMVRAALGCIEGIDDLVLLTDDQNVSMQRKERLRPDFVGISEVTHSIWIIELKNSDQTAREAFTELLGYEHEIKNYLPFLADWDVNFVLISSEWSVLLDHSLASACTWSGKKVLGLKASLDGSGDVALAVHIPESWTITGVSHFPEDSLPCFTVALSGFGNGESGDPDDRLFVALNMLAREGDRRGAHGFALIWRDYKESVGLHHLTICGIAPTAFFRTAVDIGTIVPEQGHLTEPLLDEVGDGRTPIPASLWELADYIKPIVSEVGKTTVGALSNWRSLQKTLNHQAEPVYMDMWGLLGDYARRYVLHPGIREHRRDLLVSGMQDWRSPAIGLHILEEFFSPDFCIGGEIRTRDAYVLGRDLSIDGSIRMTIDAETTPKIVRDWLVPRRYWHSVRLQILLEQVRAIFMSTATISSENSPLRYSLGSSAFSQGNLTSLASWIRSSFLANSAAHIEAFDLGMRGGPAFDDDFVRNIADIRSRLVGLATEIEDHRQSAIKLIEDLQSEAGALERHTVLLDQLRSTTVLDGHTLELSFETIDSVMPPVFHQLNRMATIAPDWTWLKQGVRESRARGDRAAIGLKADGTLGVVILTEPEYLIMPDVSDPENEVLFLNFGSGIGILCVRTWAQLEAAHHLDDPSPRGDGSI